MKARTFLSPGGRQSVLDEAKATIGVRLGKKYYIGTF
jgi:hypothetical protein